MLGVPYSVADYIDFARYTDEVYSQYASQPYTANRQKADFNTWSSHKLSTKSIYKVLPVLE